MVEKSKVKSRGACPQCQERGEDNSGDNLVLYTDGHSYCFACGYTIGVHGTEKPKIVIPKKVKDTSISSRCVGERTCRAWDIVEEYVKTTRGIEGTGSIIFPYYSAEKKLIGIKYRNFETEALDGEKDIFYEGESDLFGWHMVDNNHDECVIWEGETDCLNGWQQNPHVTNLGLPGASLAEKLIRKNAMQLRQFKKIYICMDNDDEGRVAKDVISSLLPAHITFDVTLPTKYKDFTEACQQGVAPDIYRKMMREATPFSLEDLITGKELKSQFLAHIKDGTQFQGLSTGFPGLDDVLSGGLHRAEVVLLIGYTGRGKSTFTAAVAKQMSLQGAKVMWVGTEMYPMQMMRKFLEEDLGKRFLWIDGEYTATEEEINTSLDRLTDSIVFYNSMAGDFDRLERSIITAVHQHNVGVVFIDVLSDIAEDFSEWQVAADVMQRLVLLSQGNPDDRRPPIGFFCCGHTKGEESGEITLSDIRGGAAVRQKSTLILRFEGDVDDPQRNISVLKKSRMYDATVMETAVVFDSETRRYTQLDAPEEEQPTNEKRNREARRRDSKDGTGGMDVRAKKITNPGQLPTRFRPQRKSATRGSEGYSK